MITSHTTTTIQNNEIWIKQHDQQNNNKHINQQNNKATSTLNKLFKETNTTSRETRKQTHKHQEATTYTIHDNVNTTRHGNH